MSRTQTTSSAATAEKPAKTNWLTRPIGGSGKAKQPKGRAAAPALPPAPVEGPPGGAAAPPSVAAKGGAAAAAKDAPKAAPAPIAVGGEPRVSLIPPEVLARRKARGVRRSLAWGVLGVVLITVAAVGGTAVLGIRAQIDLVAAQARTGELLAEQAQYTEVRKVQDQVSLVEAAQQVGASTEIDWKDYLQKVQATLPGDVSMTAVTIDSSTPLATYAQPTAPLQGARVATLTFEASSPTLPVVPVWLTALAKLPGFADATPGSVSLDETTKTYTLSITMHINETAFDRRFDSQEK
ncbi:hypothetical protein [Leifsonia sp. NPDC080035]|uniref:Tfp pilus assembly protein PilN n=1 Tax=Leifsonia sp. NPDC080035 TaxID=3143936 RepID=A0AAU7GC27_9MICO